jgi:hypothetical protein
VRWPKTKDGREGKDRPEVVQVEESAARGRQQLTAAVAQARWEQRRGRARGTARARQRRGRGAAVSSDERLWRAPGELGQGGGGIARAYGSGLGKEKERERLYEELDPLVT